MANPSRRQFLIKTGLGAVAIMFAGTNVFDGFARPDKQVFRGTSFLPPAYRAIRYGIDGFVEQLRRQAPESMVIEFFDSGTLMKADAQLSGLRVGTIQFINTVIARNLQEQLRFCYKLPVTAVGVAVFLLKSTWGNMPTPEKASLWQAGLWYDRHQTQIGYKKIPQEQYWPIIKTAGIEIYTPQKEELNILLRQARPIWRWWKGKVGASVGRKAIELARGDV